MSERIRFGPSGNSKSFYDEGHKHSHEMPEWIRNMGLDCYEYSCGKGTNIRTETAAKIGEAARQAGIAVSVHAPYYINFCSEDADKRDASRKYIHNTLAVAHPMGATRVVFHPGSVGKLRRGEALAMAIEGIQTLLAEVDDGPYRDITLCPETMGRLSQLGDLEEILALCRLDERLIPTIDFGHLNARGQGSIRGKDDYAAILDAIACALGQERMRRIHIHFSRIAYSKAGERVHLTLEDQEYGPFFEPLAELLVERDMIPTVLCESRDRMAEDALELKKMYMKAAEALRG
ncbi:MAG: TIM barrel protein [Christensenellales bacterium]|jgi:deoxyribonuclease-4